MRTKRLIFWGMAAMLIGIRIVTTIPYFSADAITSDIPIRPEGTPVVRDPIPTATPPPIVEEVIPGVVENQDSDVGAIIVLDASLQPTTDMWAVVEWYAPETDQWHMVEGWQGQFTNGEVQWWVGEDQLGQGPFRWVVYTQEIDGKLVKISDEFNLPASKNKQTTVNLTWP